MIDVSWVPTRGTPTKIFFEWIHLYYSIILLNSFEMALILNAVLLLVDLPSLDDLYLVSPLLDVSPELSFHDI